VFQTGYERGSGHSVGHGAGRCNGYEPGRGGRVRSAGFDEIAPLDKLSAARQPSAGKVAPSLSLAVARPDAGDRRKIIPGGQWTMHPTPGTMTLHAEAADQESLRPIQDPRHRMP